MFFFNTSFELLDISETCQLTFYYLQQLIIYIYNKLYSLYLAYMYLLSLSLPNIVDPCSEFLNK